MVVTTPWAVHRDRRWWKDPERFRPERWTSERQAGRHRYTWFPFGGGRGCTGRHFALQEAVCALRMIVQRFHLRALTTTFDIEAG